MARFNDLIKGSTPVLVDFYADWCAPCKMMAPVLKQVSSDIGEKARIINVDVDKNPQAAAKYGIQGVPTFILFKNGKLVWRQSGVVPAHTLKQVIENYL